MERGMAAENAERKAQAGGVRSRQFAVEQLRAIRLAAALGDDIRKNHPEVADEYRSGLTAPRLVEIHELDQLYEVSQLTAISAVRNAIRGYAGLLYEQYPGLLADRSERESLALAHNRQTGREEYDRKSGIHALTREQKADAGHKGGLIGGPLSYQLRIGCHALPPEVLQEHCRRIAPLGGKVGGVASVVAQGMVPYKSATSVQVSELEFASGLAADPHYLGPVRMNFKLMAQKVNEVFHANNPCYTRITLKRALQALRRCACSGAEFVADPEIAFAASLGCDPAYQLPARMKGLEIARRVNEEYQNGKPVRTPLGIRSAVQRYRRQNADPAVD